MKCGLKTFPLPIDLSDEVKLVEAEFGVNGFAVYIKLMQAIYSRGYYMKWDIDTELLFIRDYCLSAVGRNLVSEIVACCVRRGVFDIQLYQKYSILTSKRIQETFLVAMQRSKEIVFEKNYALPIVYEFIGNANKNGKNVNIFLKNVDILQQKKEKEKKRNISLSSPPTPPTGESDENTGLKVFLESHPNIEVDGYNGKISDMDFDRLSAAIEESDYLKEVTSFLWLCNQYEKIISGYFKTIKPTAKNKSDGKPAENWTDILERL